ncbi:MAG: PadR family transcriptional regulator [Candidatus Eisenbacteria bacterium]
MSPERNASTRFAILGLLGLEPMSGYDIRRASSDTLRHFWHESYGQIYPTLATLAREKLIRELPPARAAAKPGARASRKLYAITPAGRRAFAVWQESAPRERPFRSEMLLRVFFGDAGSAHALREHVGRLAKEETARLASYRALARRLRSEAASHPSQPYWQATLRYGQLRSEAALAWCRETSRTLGKARLAKKRAHA